MITFVLDDCKNVFESKFRNDREFFQSKSQAQPFDWGMVNRANWIACSQREKINDAVIQIN